MYGHNVSHSKRRTPRVFKPNLRVASIKINGRNVKLKLCVKCLRIFKKPVEKKEIVEAQAAPATI
jgi:large subunit ribosomal protein L28